MCDDFFVILSSNGQVYKTSAEMKITRVNELQRINIIDISGTFEHCFAISDDNRVFGLGNNTAKSLGLDECITTTNEFTEIKSLNKYKIIKSYAGSAHSLFQTIEGKIIACGRNNYGQCLNDNHQISTPIETSIQNNATFCIAGFDISVVFIKSNIPMGPNKKIAKFSHIFDVIA